MSERPERRFGITVPFAGCPLHQHGDLFEWTADLGYTDVWTSEVSGHDAFTPLALASSVPSLRLGTAIASVFTRGPATLAQTATALAAACEGRLVLGIGASSEVIVQRWNGVAFERPYNRVRDTLRFLRRAFAGEKVSEAYDSFSIDGFKLDEPPSQPLPILLAALQPGMLRLAGREADGVVLNWLSAEDVPTVIAAVEQPKEVVARIFVVASSDAQQARAVGRRLMATYLNVPAYAKYQEWLGRGDLLRPMWTAWNNGDRGAALDAIPDAVVDDLVIHGPAPRCRDHIERYAELGVTTTVPFLLGAEGDDLRSWIQGLSPSAAA